MENSVEVIWKPQSGPQAALVTCPVFEIFFGGARGGGKTDGVLGEFAVHAFQYKQHAIGLMVRRERTQLVEAIERSRQIYGPLGAKYHEQDKIWRFPDGGRLRFAYLENDADAGSYQGHNYTRVYVEEIGTFPSPDPILKLMATLRSGHGVPLGFRATGNPGGVGHHWVKARYIDADPLGWNVQKYSFENPFTKKTVYKDRIYIPSKISDNRYLGDDYVAQLQMAGSPELVRAWLHGDWDVIQGAYFPEFMRDKHVVPPMAIPGHWLKFMAIDWGSSSPFAVLWIAVADGVEGHFPKGSLVVYKEWYGGKDNVGIKLTAEEFADGILARSKPMECRFTVMDPSAFKTDGGPSIAERMGRRGVYCRKADNKRIAGWDQVRQRLKGAGGEPLLYITSNCTELIRTLPSLQHDTREPEDADSTGDDHAPDSLRYGCMARPWTIGPNILPQDKLHILQNMTFEQAFPIGHDTENRVYKEERI